MLIAKETALSIVQEMKAAAGCDINLMDDTGRILASTDSARMGQVHAGAKALLEQGLDRLVAHEDAPQQGTRRGSICPSAWTAERWASSASPVRRSRWKPWAA